MVIKQRKQLPHYRFVFALEGEGTAERRKLLPAYKTGRTPSPKFNEARNEVISMLRHTHCTIIRAADGEADDAIATFVTTNEGHHVILSNDRDLWQLITPRVTVEAKVRGGTIQVDRFACKRLYGIEPTVIPLAKALLGDKSDTIPRGVPQVVEAKLLRLASEAKEARYVAKVVTEADWFTDAEKKKIRAGLSTVKLHEQVTRVRTNLKLRAREYKGNLKKMQTFLAARSLDIEDVEILVGAQT
jgi:5'-3' exonuclease